MKFGVKKSSSSIPLLRSSYSLHENLFWSASRICHSEASNPTIQRCHAFLTRPLENEAVWFYLFVFVPRPNSGELPYQYCQGHISRSVATLSLASLWHDGTRVTPVDFPSHVQHVSWLPCEHLPDPDPSLSRGISLCYMLAHKFLLSDQDCPLTGHTTKSVSYINQTEWPRILGFIPMSTL